METVECSPFNELLIEDFDNDQIWEEIASQNEPFLQYAKATLKTLSKGPIKTDKSDSEDEMSVSGNSMDLDDLESQKDDDVSEEMDEDEEMEEENEFDDEELEENFNEEELDEEEMGGESDEEEIGEEFDDEKRG